ncbi:ras gtpase-activating protein-binding [Plasmopara halstedii]|uniref:Ras gtpase-activating protein-binding n=1 Tax=Plasmopara halstedii TaxID=4781 RepID=A0A0P1AP85_PLAHL|nr:ras gtpase-activating protein-binding [Plasmopara halstedii]CEG42842.1 ras gtpase-activating protein-binding [Plasmopara halstedii]|eukprot:XP_024579211.1 ras gtpase-activating protein-binding [Plasmopara halstedii]
MPETSTPAAPTTLDVEMTPSPSSVGNSFMRQYYHFLAKEPQSMHRFYKAESRWCHGVGSHMEEPIAGQRAINEQILKRGYAGARVDLDAGSIDCQNSQGNGVLVLVTGVMVLRESPTPKPFVQTFFLAVQPKGYFVLNDCLRFLELPGVSSVEVALDVAANGIKTTLPPSPVKKLQKETPASVSPTLNSPIDNNSIGAKTEVVAPVSPVKATATVASTPNTRTTKTEDSPAPVVRTPSPVKSPQKQDKTPVAATSPNSVVEPVAAPSDPVVPVTTEPEKPKSWAALFSASNAPATNASSVGTASAPTKPATPEVGIPVSPSVAVSTTTVLPSAEESPKNKSGTGKEKDHKRFHSLFIRDVPPQTRENDLRDLFKGYGSIAGVSVVAQRGFAFVDYYEQESMRAALAETTEFKINDKVLQVGERAERKENQRGSFRNNDSRGRGRGGLSKGGRGERKERSGDETSFANKGERRDFPRREKSGNRRGGKVDATLNRVE